MGKRQRGVSYLEVEKAHDGDSKTDSNSSLRESKHRTLDEFLRQMDDPDYWKTIPAAGEMQSDLILTEEEIEMIKRIDKHEFADLQYDPYQPFEDFFTKTLQKTPLNTAPEPKRRFVESRWEAKKIKKIVLAIRRGLIKVVDRNGDKMQENQPKIWDLWETEDDKHSTKLEDRLAPRISAPKTRLPSDAESYNPPATLLPSKEEIAAWNEASHYEDRQGSFLVQKFDAFRTIPAYDQFIQERFSRCLDLYLCPRALRKRSLVEDPETLLPPMPDIADLRPFPTKLAMEYLGHAGKVTGISVDPSGNWILSTSQDCTLKLWEVESGRCHKTWTFPFPTANIQWNPREKGVFCFSSDSTLYVGFAEAVGSGGNGEDSLIFTPKNNASNDQWKIEKEQKLIQIPHLHPISSLSWHPKGDYFCSVCSDTNNSIVQVHLLSKHRSQNPFKKASTKGIVKQAIFHPFKPYLLVAWQKTIKIFNLAPTGNEQPLLKKINVGVSSSISWMDIHAASGAHLLVASNDSKVMWFDLETMGTTSGGEKKENSLECSTAYRKMRYHREAVKCVKFHPKYPFFASAGDDATIQLFHGRVWEADVAKDPLIVPLHVIRGNKIVDSVSVLGLDFHPTEPWLFAATAENSIKLYT